MLRGGLKPRMNQEQLQESSEERDNKWVLGIAIGLWILYFFFVWLMIQ